MNNQNTFPQVPIPELIGFLHNHKCVNCKKWTIFGRVIYADNIENTIFICKICAHLLHFEQLPKKTKFRNFHECIQCHKRKKIGVLTYCSRCEVGEFVCPLCLRNWFNKIAPNEYGYEFKPKWE